MEALVWVFWIFLLAVFVVCLYRLTKSQDEIDDELEKYVAAKLKECEEEE